MTKTDFFSQLQTLSLEQLSVVHKNILNKIKMVRKEEKQQQLDFLNVQKAEEKEKQENAKKSHSSSQETTFQASHLKPQPKMPASNLNIRTMADNLDLDLSGIMREISKR